MKIAYLTSVHPRTDTRVFEKMCERVSGNNEVVLLLLKHFKENLYDNIINNIIQNIYVIP